MLEFEFVALSYFQSKKNQYAYKIEGLQEEWVDLGTKNSFSLGNLNPGTYILHIKGSNHHRVWNEEGISLKIVVTPPFWQTWWFRISTSLVLLILIYCLYKLRLQQLQKQKKVLETKVQKQTAQLAEKNIDKSN